MPELTISKQEKRWMAEEDARTIAESEIIKNDRRRLIAAKRAALDLAKQEKEKADAMKAVAKTKPGAAVVRRKPRPKGENKKKEVNSYNVFKKI